MLASCAYRSSASACVTGRVHAMLVPSTSVLTTRATLTSNATMATVIDSMAVARITLYTIITQSLLATATVLLTLALSTQTADLAAASTSPTPQAMGSAVGLLQESVSPIPMTQAPLTSTPDTTGATMNSAHATQNAPPSIAILINTSALSRNGAIIRVPPKSKGRGMETAMALTILYGSCLGV